MESNRISKISRLLQRELSDIFQKESRNLFTGKMVSATVVRVSPDLGLAKVYISVFPKVDNPVEMVSQHSSKIKYELGNRLRHQLRKIPDLVFYLDDSLDYIENIENILKK